MKYLTHFLIAFLLVWSTQGMAAPTYMEYKGFSSNNSVTLDDLRLTDQELRWLASKKNIIIAIHHSETSTLLHKDSEQRARGINADYLDLLQKTLKVKIILREYPGEDDAVAALENGEVDATLTQLTNTRIQNPSLNRSDAMIITFPALVTTVNDSMRPLSTQNPVTLARVGSYPSDAVIATSFPNATIVSYPTFYQALASVSSGENYYFIGSNIITSNMISRYFTHTLNVVKYYDSPRQFNYFLTRKNTAVLPGILNHFMAALTNEVRSEVAQNWLDSGNLAFLNKPLALTAHEKQWIHHHAALKMQVNPYYPPFSMTDENGAVRGVMGDLLNIIELQTGLKFVPVPARPDARPGAQLSGGDWDIFPGAIYSEAREHQVAFSETVLTTPYVFVMQKTAVADQMLKPGMKVAVPPYYGLDKQLKEKFPDMEWVPVENASAAFHQVQEGRLDAVVATQLTARYMIDHYYPEELDFFLVQGVAGASIAFALPRAEPELKSILDKALNEIPPSELLRLTEKWTKMPNVTIDTWDLYSNQFYVVTTLAVLLVVSSLLWGFYMLREVRRRKAIQGDLENQISFRQALSDSLPTPSYVVSQEGKIVSHNRAFGEYFAKAYYDNAALPLTDLRSPFTRILPAFAEVSVDEQGNRTICTRELEISNGREPRYIHHWHTLCNMPASDDTVFICGWEDITETRELIRALENEKNKAVRATVAKSQFLASMSHEIRTPVSSIMGFLELLSGEGLDQAQRAEAISLAYATGQSLLGLIGDILDVDKIESGNYQLQPQWVPVVELIETTRRSFDALAARKQINLNLDCTLDPNCLIRTDPQAFKQVLTNLLSNALKFTTQGSVTIAAVMTVQGADRADLRLSVTDSGCGMTEQEQQQLFRRYSQARAGRQQTGSGLGLMICKQLTEKMQGEISLDSQPGKGTTFTFTLPVEVSTQKTDATGHTPQALLLPARLQILVADDHPTNRLLLKRQLNLMGYAVDEACDGKEALQKISEKKYDLLITDVNMPVMDGFGLTRTLRMQQHRLPIWGLTANAQIHERDRGLSCGMDLCLFKPLTLEVLKSHLSRLPEVASCPGEYAHLDWEALQDNTDNDPALMREILLTFRQEAHKDLAAARQAFREDNKRVFRQRVHRIHGAASLLCLRHLSDISHQLETLPVIADNQGQITRLLDAMGEILSELDQEISRFCDNKR